MVLLLPLPIHPYGGIDGIIMLNTMLEKRPDFKLMGNFLLQKNKTH
jgi:hypothetical protein